MLMVLAHNRKPVAAVLVDGGIPDPLPPPSPQPPGVPPDPTDPIRDPPKPPDPVPPGVPPARGHQRSNATPPPATSQGCGVPDTDPPTPEPKPPTEPDGQPPKPVRHAMSSRLIGLLWLIALSLGLAVPCPAQSAGDVDAAVAEIRAEVLGAPIYASDGPEVGTVTDIDFDEGGEPRRLRMTVAASLGLGARAIEVPAGASSSFAEQLFSTCQRRR
jgi:hypothetical protein